MNSRLKIIFILVFLGFCTCGRNPFFEDPLFTPYPMLLTAIPCEKSVVSYMCHYGPVDYGGGQTGFHSGIDMGCTNGGKFYACANGIVESVSLNTGQGLPGTNYRIRIIIGGGVILDYHFEINGSIGEQERRNSILINAGDRVRAGQHIADLISLGGGAHVDFGVSYNGSRVCPKPYFSEEAAREFENLYNSGIEKKPVKPYLFE
jgi:murein DD-endopeptidase MepM/ murein hydrolase activator NlpD